MVVILIFYNMQAALAVLYQPSYKQVMYNWYSLDIPFPAHLPGETPPNRSCSRPEIKVRIESIFFVFFRFGFLGA